MNAVSPSPDPNTRRSQQPHKQNDDKDNNMHGKHDGLLFVSIDMREWAEMISILCHAHVRVYAARMRSFFLLRSIRAFFRIQISRASEN